MAQLTDEEKRGLLEEVHSAELRKDLDIVRQNSERLAQQCTLDDYLDFLNVMNEFCSHAVKTSPQMTGTRFLL